MEVASSIRYGMQEITLVTTSTDSERKVSQAESSSVINTFKLVKNALFVLFFGTFRFADYKW